ncbi:sigma-70 family RNA polymerase sigma factor (plasmid) [Pseudarthrobacter sp. P1]|uniref:sigma-70 family RNA polymerase sigma factor n=1 Tax=Pseudarthrobacter sp. P1 TaxID=3418418 RepID=UPI003CFAB318
MDTSSLLSGSVSSARLPAEPAGRTRLEVRAEPQTGIPGKDVAAMNGNARASALLCGPNPGTAVQDSVARAIAPEHAPSGLPLSSGPAIAEPGESVEQLVLQFLRVADAISRRYRAPGCEAEDLQQVARLGLVKAARGYRESRGHGFMAYAVPTITGELKRYLRDHSWVVRPPRPIQEVRLTIRQVRPELTQRLGRDPSPAELSSAAGISVMDTAQALLAEAAMVAQQIEHNDPPERVEGRGLGVILAEEDPGYERIDQEQSLEAALSDASEEDRRLLHLRFVQEMSQGQIALEFGVSQMQISRLLKQLLDRLGRRLTEPREMVEGTTG